MSVWVKSHVPSIETRLDRLNVGREGAGHRSNIHTPQDRGVSTKLYTCLSCAFSQTQVPTHPNITKHFQKWQHFYTHDFCPNLAGVFCFLSCVQLAHRDLFLNYEASIIYLHCGTQATRKYDTSTVHTHNRCKHR